MGTHEYVGKAVIESIREPPLREVANLSHGEIRGPSGQRWAATLSKGDAREVVRTIAPEIVDEVIFRLLLTVDEGILDLVVRDSSGRAVASSMGDVRRAADLSGVRAAHSASRLPTPSRAVRAHKRRRGLSTGMAVPKSPGVVSRLVTRWQRT